MGRSVSSISAEELAELSRQCAALHEDWQRFYQLASQPEGGDGTARQLAFIQLQSRFSCDYPIISRWRKANFGLAPAIAALVARAGTLDAFAREAQQGAGALVRDWHEINGSIARVRALLETAARQARPGQPVKLPRELAVTIAREPWPVAALGRKAGVACAVLVVAGVIFLIARPFLLETGLFKWVDQSYTAWQLRNGLPGIDYPVPPGGGE